MAMVVLAALLAIIVLSVGAGELVRLQCDRWMRTPLQPARQRVGGAGRSSLSSSGSAAARSVAA